MNVKSVQSNSASALASNYPNQRRRPAVSVSFVPLRLVLAVMGAYQLSADKLRAVVELGQVTI